MTYQTLGEEGGAKASRLYFVHILRISTYSCMVLHIVSYICIYLLNVLFDVAKWLYHWQANLEMIYERKLNQQVLYILLITDILGKLRYSSPWSLLGTRELFYTS